MIHEILLFFRSPHCSDCVKRNEFDELLDEIKTIKKTIKKLKKNQNDVPDCELFNGITMAELSASVKYCPSLYDGVQTLLHKLFNEEEIEMCSVSGKAANSKLVAKPRFEERRFNAILVTLRSAMDRAIKPKDITAKVHAVQKKYRRESLKMSFL